MVQETDPFHGVTSLFRIVMGGTDALVTRGIVRVGESDAQIPDCNRL
jgi:hypothetical protein